MNDIPSFNQFLSTETASLSISGYVLNLFLTALLAFILGVVYNRYGNSISNRSSFSKNFVLLAVTTMIIITIVKSSLALSLGLVGALSIVRFRAAIKEPEELAYLFLNIAIGLGFGADQKAVTILGFLFLAVFLVVRKYFFNTTHRKENTLLLTVSSTDTTQNQASSIASVLEKYCEEVALKRYDESGTLLEMVFVVKISDFSSLTNITKVCKEQFKDTSLSFMENNLHH